MTPSPFIRFKLFAKEAVYARYVEQYESNQSAFVP
jgi:hypothetical protein